MTKSEQYIADKIKEFNESPELMVDREVDSSIGGGGMYSCLDDEKVAEFLSQSLYELEDIVRQEEIKRPKYIRKGQMIFNFLEWLHLEKELEFGGNYRMADPFYLSDEDWDSYYQEYLDQLTKEGK